MSRYILRYTGELSTISSAETHPCPGVVWADKSVNRLIKPNYGVGEYYRIYNDGSNIYSKLYSSGGCSKIYYTTSNGQSTSITALTADSTVSSHTYSNGVGIITFNDSITYIGSSSFYENSNLQSIILPEGLERIEFNAFYGCTYLNSVSLPSTLTTIGANAFWGCYALTSITIPNLVTSIETNAFCDCTGLTYVSCESLTPPAIGEDVFFNISTTPIQVPVNSVSLYTNAWSDYANWIVKNDEIWYRTSDGNPSQIRIDCDSETEEWQYGTPGGIVFPLGGVAMVSNSAYTNDWIILKVDDPIHSMTSVYHYGLQDYYCMFEEDVETVILPNSITSLAKAFIDETGLTTVALSNYSSGSAVCYNCDSLTSVTIPNSVTTIGEWAFYQCTGLISVTIGNSVTTIGISAFFECLGLSSITIPNSVTTIGNYGFEQCDNLTSITIGNSVTTIGEGAFYDCNSLSSITIPASVTYIDNYAFYECDELSEVICNATTPPTLCTDVFEFTNISSIKVPSGSVDAYKTATNWSAYANIITSI